jgi:hypothetical protein
MPLSVSFFTHSYHTGAGTEEEGNFEHLFNFEANLKMVSGSGSSIFSNCGSRFRIRIPGLMT